MALLNSEDFAIWFLRTSYLQNVKDGASERLISVNNSILNTPGFRAAGWTTDPVQRTYSPPIPTTGASEYFQNEIKLHHETAIGDDEDEGGMVTGRTSNDTIGPGPHFRRKRRKDAIEDDDSSDLSDESDDVDGGQRAAQQIRFAKMPARSRADSSPIRTNTSNPDVRVISPSIPEHGRRRTGSLGAVEAVKARARAGTATSSDMSSENELDPAYFRRRQVNRSQLPRTARSEDLPESVGSALSSELAETVDSNSVLNAAHTADSPSSSPILAGVGLSSVSSKNVQAESPRKTRTLPILQELPPPRPISVIEPVSLLSQALNSKKQKPMNPIERFATLSAKGTPNPLWIKIFAPFSSEPDEPFEMPLDRASKEGAPVIVAEAIGLALWRYMEEKREPPLTPEQQNVNKWMFRMVEDGEVDYDFPALGRSKPVTDFTSNNNRGARARSRERPFDEFALVEANTQQLKSNNRETPQFVPTAEEDSVSVPQAVQSEGGPGAQPSTGKGQASRSNVLLAGQPFASALANTATTPADQPAAPGPQATPRVDRTKTIRVRFFDIDTVARSTTLELSTDSYIAEILDQVCKKWNLDKAFFAVKVAGTNTVAPLDRTVEALGTRSDLELVRRRFGTGPAALTGSPGSASPNAPLLLDIQGPKKGKKGQASALQAMAQKEDLLSSASNFKKYYVTRKQLTSFAQGGQRVLIFDGDFLHVMPTDTAKSSYAKSRSIAFSEILKCKVSTKHSKLVRVTVRRNTEAKRYDLEARTALEAQEIVDEISREMRLAKGTGEARM
ncbi:hypothetical protein DV738_g5368, partial [Chaetothyriales sp. CBS 135597]